MLQVKECGGALVRVSAKTIQSELCCFVGADPMAQAVAHHQENPVVSLVNAPAISAIVRAGPGDLDRSISG